MPSSLKAKAEAPHSRSEGLSKPAPPVLIGAFPPPVHGLSAVNAAVYSALMEKGHSPHRINLAGVSLRRDLWSQVQRLPRVLRGLGAFAVLSTRPRQTMYISVSGGMGQLYELLFVAVGRFCRARIFLHHHSFAYIDQPNLITRMLLGVAGGGATQIVLSPGMGERLKSRYPVRALAVVSNAALLLDADASSFAQRDQLRSVGFISNIAAEKGIFEFLDLIAAAEGMGLGVVAKIAGPFQDTATEARVAARLRSLRSVEYVGPVYGERKETFFSQIDVLVFPTRYLNEAEPLVLHEAMSRGVPVIAYGRGAIPEIVAPGAGKVVEPATPFVPAALKQLRAWLEDSSSFARASQVARQSFSDSRAAGERRWRALLAQLAGNDS